MGDGTTANKSTPVRVQQEGETAETFIDNTTKWKAVSAGGEHTVGLAEDGTLWSWGENGKGQLGDGTTANKSIPVRVQQKTEAETFVDNRTKWKAVSAGGEHTVGLAEDGTLWTWGENGKGQLGDGTAINKSIPVRIQQGGTTWKAVSAGEYYTVGIDIDGHLWSWGKNDKGQLGDGTKENKSIPVRVQKKTEEETFVDNTTKWKAVSAGGKHTVGIDSDGTLWSWGYNGNGQLGDGTIAGIAGTSIPVRLQQKTEEGAFVDNTTKWKAVSAGYNYTVGIDSDGTLWSWGRDDDGQLGDGTTANKSIPVRVQQAGGTANPFIDNTTKWKAASTGRVHTVGIDSDGNLWVWGYNEGGELGDGTTTQRNTPVKIQIPKK